MSRPTGYGSRGDAPCIATCMNCRKDIGRRPSSITTAWCPGCNAWVHVHKRRG